MSDILKKMREAATTLENEYIKKWKEKGGKIIGYSCTFMPVEIIHAAGILPVRLRGLGITSLAIGDTYYGPVVCSVPKCYVQLGGEGKYKFLDGAIITNGCDSMRRAYDNWIEADKDIPGSLPGFFEFMGVPHKAVDYTIDYYAEDLKMLVAKIEKHFQVKITDEKLKKSIALYNEGRLLLQKLDALRWRKDVPINGEDAMAVLIASQVIPREEFNPLLQALLTELEKAPAISNGKKRVMLIGSANDDIEFVKVIEDSGTVVVSDTVCFGARTYANQVDEKGDSFQVLSAYYLENNICPRMLGFYPERITYIQDLARKSAVDGAVLQNVRFCDLHGSENGVIERDLEEIGIPCMRLEREYGPLAETGRIRMRIDALVERIR